jgi:hypothetical protein
MSTELELLSNMYDAAKKDKKHLIALKNMAVKTQQFELASRLREIEKELFPLNGEEKEAEEIGKQTQIALGMSGLKCNNKLAYVVHETMKSYFEKLGQFSLEDGSKIQSNSEKYFIFDE